MYGVDRNGTPTAYHTEALTAPIAAMSNEDRMIPLEE